MEQNRHSARASRERKRLYYESLERKVATMSRLVDQLRAKLRMAKLKSEHLQAARRRLTDILLEKGYHLDSDDPVLNAGAGQEYEDEDDDEDNNDLNNDPENYSFQRLEADNDHTTTAQQSDEDIGTLSSTPDGVESTTTTSPLSSFSLDSTKRSASDQRNHGSSTDTIQSRNSKSLLSSSTGTIKRRRLSKSYSTNDGFTDRDDTDYVEPSSARVSRKPRHIHASRSSSMNLPVMSARFKNHRITPPTTTSTASTNNNSRATHIDNDNDLTESDTESESLDTSKLLLNTTTTTLSNDTSTQESLPNATATSTTTPSFHVIDGAKPEEYSSQESVELLHVLVAAALDS